MESVAGGEVEEEFAAEFGVDGGDMEFFLAFADSGLECGFAGFDAPAGGVDFTCAEAAFFADEEDIGGLGDEAEGCAVVGGPVVLEDFKVHEGLEREFALDIAGRRG